MTAVAIFRLPQRANVERAIEALRSLNPDIVAHLEREQLARAKAGLIFAYWAKCLHHGRALLDKKRERRLLARLQENAGDVSELLYVVDGARHDDWLMGRDPRSDRRYDGIETIFRDREQVERLAETCDDYRSDKPHPLAVKYNLV